MIFSRRIFFFTAISASCLAISCGGGKENGDQKKSQSPPAIEGFIVKPQAVSENIEVSGTLLPFDETTLMPEVSGRITMLHLPEGGRVSRGTLLVKLFDADLQAQRTKLDAQLKTAKATLERQKELLKINGISQQEYDLSATQVTAIEADIAAVDAGISKTEIRAPFDGTIGLRNVSEGAFVSPGTALAVIRTDKQLKLDFSVPEMYAGSITPSLKIMFTVDGDTGRYTATVLATEQSVDEGTLNLRVRAIVNGNPRLLPGASAKVNLGFAPHENALLIPTQAVIPQARFKNVIVARRGKAEFAKVQTGVRRAEDVEIISGLHPGDTVVTTGIQFIRPGTPLKFTSVK